MFPVSGRASAASASMEVFDVRPACPVLPNVLWGEIAQFLPRNDVLHLRTTRRHMVACVDRSIKSLQVTAACAPGILALVSRSTGLKHVDALSLFLCTSKNFPRAITALAVLAHARLALTIERSTDWQLGRGDTLLNAGSMTCLRDIRPASLCIQDHDVLSMALIQILAELTYPIALTVGRYRYGNVAELRALAGIPELYFLNVQVEAFHDDVALAFRDHGRLEELRIEPIGAIALSDMAVAHLADIPTLRKLMIGETAGPLGEHAVAALSRHRGLESLVIGTRHHPMDSAAALVLSENATLKTLSVSLTDGWSHLAVMTSLECLTLYGAIPISLDEARRFVQRADLETLDISGATFEREALVVMVGAAVKNLEMSVESFNAREIDALLANRTLRCLNCSITGRYADGIANVIALAAHPMLDSLVVKYAHDQARLFRDGGLNRIAARSDSMMTEVERRAMLEAWGRHRPTSALRLGLLSD